MRIDIVKVCAGLIVILALLMFSSVATETTWRHSGFELWGYDINCTDHNLSNVKNIDATNITVDILNGTDATITDFIATNITATTYIGYPSASGGSNGSYSFYIHNNSGTYTAYSSTGTAVYSGTNGWDVLNQSYNTSSATHIYLSANTNITDIPAASNNLPPITIIGEDWKLNKLAVINPTVNFLGGQPGCTLINLAIQDAFNEDPAYPAGSVRPLKYWSNTGRTTNEAIANWGDQSILLIGGDSGIDNPIFGILNAGCGDSIYIQLKDSTSNATGSGLRIDTANSNDNPLLYFNQIGTTSHAPFVRMNLSVTQDINVMEMNVAGKATPSWKMDSAGQTTQYLSGAGFTMRAPNGNYYCLTVNNAGALSIAANVCEDISML
jgi:hypothetical protein